MYTNKVFIGNVFQITSRKEKDPYDIFSTINFEFEMIKENALLYRNDNNIFIDIETKQIYKSNLDSNRYFGDSFVFTDSLKSFSSLIEKSQCCSNMKKGTVKKLYKAFKKNQMLQS